METDRNVLIGEELVECLIDALMHWSLGSQLTPTPIDRDVRELIALGAGFLDKTPSTGEFDVNHYPVYISEPLVILFLRSLFAKLSRTRRQASWILQSFRNARRISNSSVGFAFEEAPFSCLWRILEEITKHSGTSSTVASY